MLTRIVNNWTLTRGFYLIAGLFLMVQAYMDKQWLGLAFGGYFVAMGIFAFGCAAGNCSRPFTSKATPEEGTECVKFEEIKTQ